MTWLVTGGAGYIGAHVVDSLRFAGLAVVVLDDLSTGHREFVPPGVPLIAATVLDTDTVTETLQKHAVSGVIHCAGYKFAGESVARPLHTWQQNVDGTESLLNAMETVGVTALVFSGSAAIYGSPSEEIVTEQSPDAPESPYGESKLAAEVLIRERVAATAESASPLVATSLRFFNVIGSGGVVYDSSPHNVIPRVFAGLLDGHAPVINGDDFATPDGTCIRDYIDVHDVALAHVEAAKRLEAHATIEPVYNLGSGMGTSVRSIIDAVMEVTGTTLVPTVGSRRAGDPTRIVADGKLAARDLGWATRHSVLDMVASAWAAHPHPTEA